MAAVPARARTKPRKVVAGPFDPAERARYPALIGCDEVGRGALSGPVVVAAVWFDPEVFPPDLLGRLDDSKRLAEPVRDAFAPLIRRHARVALAAGSRAMIDRHNIRAATLAAMERAVARLGIEAPVRVDGRDVPSGLVGRCEAVIGGDASVPQIAAASIVAKVLRDGLMRRLALRHLAYGWERNVGYGTRTHVEAIVLHGPTAHHRASFAPRALQERMIARM